MHANKGTHHETKPLTSANTPTEKSWLKFILNQSSFDHANQHNPHHSFKNTQHLHHSKTIQLNIMNHIPHAKNGLTQVTLDSMSRPQHHPPKITRKPNRNSQPKKAPLTNHTPNWASSKGKRPSFKWTRSQNNSDPP